MPPRPRPRARATKRPKAPPDNALNPAVTRIPRKSDDVGSQSMEASGFVQLAQDQPADEPATVYHYRHRTLTGPVVTMSTRPRSQVSLAVRNPQLPPRMLGVICRAHDAGTIALALVKGF